MATPPKAHPMIAPHALAPTTKSMCGGDDVCLFNWGEGASIVSYV